MPRFWDGLKEDFRALYAKLNREEWVTFRDLNGHAWLPMYTSYGAPMATVVQYQYKTLAGEMADSDLANDGDFEAACLRGTARKRIVRPHHIRGGLISLEDLEATGESK